MGTQTAAFTLTDASGATSTVTGSFEVSAPAPQQRWGMQVIDGWDAKLAMVGPNGITGRRWYGNLTADGSDKLSSLRATVADGMTPFISDKVPSFTNAAAGAYDAWARARANALDSLGVPVYYAIWHEPYDDMSASEFVAMQCRLIPFFTDKPNIRVGFVLHGWLLDNPSLRESRFGAYIATTLAWDFVGIDSYQTGTDAAPGSIMPHWRLNPLKLVMKAKGLGSLPIVIAEWNAWTAAGIEGSGGAFAYDPQVEWAYFWNNTGGVGKELSTGDPRLDKFKTAKAHPKIQQWPSD